MIFEGIYPALTTPFQADGEVDFDGLAFNLARYNQLDLAGYVVLGTSGEFPLLSPDEKMQLVESVRRQTGHGKSVLAGTGAESTRETIRLSRQAVELGVDAVLVLPPHYFKASMSEMALEMHFRAVADSVAVPVLLYNMPSNTGLNLSTSLVKRLAMHPNIVGLKDSGGNLTQFEEIIADIPNGFSVLTGTGSLIAPALAMGAKGAILAIANVLPEMCLAIYRAVLEGHWVRARTLQLAILQANAAATSRWGVAGMKQAMNLVGLKGGLTRPPLQPFDPGLLPELQHILEEAKQFSNK